jgi:hypothetical protein
MSDRSTRPIAELPHLSGCENPGLKLPSAAGDRRTIRNDWEGFAAPELGSAPPRLRNGAADGADADSQRSHGYDSDNRLRDVWA